MTLIIIVEPRNLTTLKRGQGVLDWSVAAGSVHLSTALRVSGLVASLLAGGDCHEPRRGVSVQDVTYMPDADLPSSSAYTAYIAWKSSLIHCRRPAGDGAPPGAGPDDSCELG